MTNYRAKHVARKHLIITVVVLCDSQRCKNAKRDQNDTSKQISINFVPFPVQFLLQIKLNDYIYLFCLCLSSFTYDIYAVVPIYVPFAFCWNKTQRYVKMSLTRESQLFLTILLDYYSIEKQFSRLGLLNDQNISTNYSTFYDQKCDLEYQIFCKIPKFII